MVVKNVLIAAMQNVDNVIHELDILPVYYKQICNCNKKFELRRDRGFKIGDKIKLNEIYSESDTRKTGNNRTLIIKYILKNVPKYGLNNGFVIISF